MLKQWPIFLIGIGTVMAFAAGLGVLLARWKVLPGTTAIWGSSPGRGDRHGADGRGVRRRHPAGRGHAISARRLRRADRLDRRPGMGRLQARSAPAPTDWFPALTPGPLLATLAIAVGGAVRRREIQDPRRPVAGDARDRRRACGDPSRHDHPAALASRRLLRRGRLVDRPPLHAPDRRLRGAPIAAHRRLDPRR